MSARVFVHPRTAEGPAAGALVAYLEGQGYDMARLAVFREARKAPLTPRYELVRPRGNIGEKQLLERMDGVQFTHCLGEVKINEPESA